MADLCLRHGKFLLVDEIHAPLVLPGAAQVPFLSLDHEATPAAIAFSSASKGWNIPGLKCGIAIAGSDELAALLDAAVGGAACRDLGVLASVAAFEESLPWLDAALAQLDENRGYLSRLLSEHLPAVRYVPPQASFLAWLDCARSGSAMTRPRPSWPVAGSRWPPARTSARQGKGFARLNMGTSPALMLAAVRRMAAATAA